MCLLVIEDEPALCNDVLVRVDKSRNTLWAEQGMAFPARIRNRDIGCRNVWNPIKGK